MGYLLVLIIVAIGSFIAGLFTQAKQNIIKK